MKRRGWSGTAAVLIAALVGATMPAAPAQAAEAGDDSMGAAITIGLMVTVVVVYGLVSLRSDVERYTQADKENAMARAAKMAEESPIVLQAVTAPIGLGSPGGGGRPKSPARRLDGASASDGKAGATAFLSATPRPMRGRVRVRRA